MTRENKLALVVGFGLILLVGILISDHFSAARNQSAAQFTPAVDPLDAGRWENPDLLVLRTGGAEADVPDGDPLADGSGAGDGRDPTQVRPVDPERQVAVDPIANTPRTRTTQATPGQGAAAANPGERIHVVAPSDSLTRICQRYYGEATLVAALAEFNGIANPDLVRVNDRLRIPDATRLRGGGMVTAAPPPEDRAPPATTATRTASEPATTYAVKEGDVLTEIAQRLLGSASKYTVLFELNRDVLEDPDDLAPGMILKVPTDAG